jgi:hypothetical protein
VPKTLVDQTLADQVRDACTESGKTLRQLIDGAELEVSVPGLSRRLAGKLPWRLEEVEALARHLEFRLIYPTAPPRSRAA